MSKQLKKPSDEKVKKYNSFTSSSKKVEAILAYVKNGGELTGNSVYNGKPVGQWAVQIRSYFNSDRSIALTEEELKQLKEAGVLERQFESTIDEKIQELVDWNAKYPMAKTFNTYDDISHILRNYSSSNEEYQSLLSQYEKMQKYYTYVRDRRVKRKPFP